MKLLMFSGKGGVGKTTCAAAAAVHFAGLGLQTLVFSTDPAHSLADSLDFRPDRGIKPERGTKPDWGIRPVKVAPNLQMVELQAEQLLSEMKQKYHDELQDLLTTGTYLDEEDADQLVSLTVPGVDEIMGLKIVLDFVEKQAYDVYIWDTAPTGHTLRLLALPAELDNWIKALAKVRWKYREVMSRFARRELTEIQDDLLLSMKKSIQKLNKVITDPSQCQFTGVTIPESMAVEETKRLKHSLQRNGISMAKLIVNNVAPADSDCAFCRARYSRQAILLTNIKKIFSDCKVQQVPQFSEEIKGMLKLKEFADYLFPVM